MGRYVLKALLSAGAEVTVANRGTREENAGVRNVICDRSKSDALSQFADSNFDVVIDFSAYSSVWVKEAGEFFASKIKKYIFISTGAVYTSSDVFPIKEDFPKGPPHPFADYAMEKNISESLLSGFSDKGYFTTAVCRLPFVLGPCNYEDRESFVFSRLLLERPILLENGGKSIHSFIYAGDVADAVITIMGADESIDKQAFNIAIPEGTTSRGFVEIAGKVCNKSPNFNLYNPDKFKLDVENFNLRDVAFPFPENNAFLSSEKIERGLGFIPKKSLSDMLEIYFEWWLRQDDLAPKEYGLEQRILKTLLTQT